MQLLIKPLVIFCLISLISACATTKQTGDEDKRTKAAKVNAQLGIAYLERNNLQRAKQKLLLALDEGPTIPETWYSMAYFLEATGDKEQAKAYYLKAIAVAPTRGDAQNNYGTFLCRNGNYQESLQHFDLAVKDPSYLGPADAFENAGLCALRIPDSKRATAYFKQAVARDPSRPVSFYKLAELNYKEGKYEASRQMLDQFLVLSPATEKSRKFEHQLVAAMEKKEPTVVAMNDEDETLDIDDKDSEVKAKPIPAVVKPVKQKIAPKTLATNQSNTKFKVHSYADYKKPTNKKLAALKMKKTIASKKQIKKQHLAANHHKTGKVKIAAKKVLKTKQEIT